MSHGFPMVPPAARALLVAPTKVNWPLIAAGIGVVAVIAVIATLRPGGRGRG